MATNLKNSIPPGLGLLAVFAVMAILAILTTHVINARFLPGSELALEIVFLVILGAVYTKIATARLNKLQQANDTLTNSIMSLHLDKHRAEMVLANMADGVIAVDCKGKITLFNSAAGQIFRRKPSHVVGQSLVDVDLHPEVARLALECISDRKVLESEIKLPGVPQHMIQMRTAPFRAIDPALHGCIGKETKPRCFGNLFPKRGSFSGATDTGTDCAMIILHDLSEIRRHEQNQKEFVSNVSHELKTPITAIRTTAEVLLAGAKNDEEVVDRFLNTIVSETDRLSALIDDLMEIARRDSGITKVEKADTNVAEIINRALTAILPQAAQKDVKLEISVPKALVGYCDDIQIMQLIRNLVENAVKYTPSGGTVEVAAQKSDSGLVIWVKDTGIGIPHGEIDRIFERFYRVDKARSRRLGGTGLGLSIVKDIVESHGGEISIETQLGRGSKFIVTLPLGD